MFYNSIGILKYSDNPYKLIVEVDEEISRYYRYLVPKFINLKKQAFPAHISVVRKEIPLNTEFWKKYNNIEINFIYENIIYNDNTYYWLNAFSPKLEKIRLELGLPNISDITCSPDKKHKFHITIGNLKKITVT